MRCHPDSHEIKGTDERKGGRDELELPQLPPSLRAPGKEHALVVAMLAYKYLRPIPESLDASKVHYTIQHEICELGSVVVRRTACC